MQNNAQNPSGGAGQEPVSGVTGAGTAGQAYDGGNDAGNTTGSSGHYDTSAGQKLDQGTSAGSGVSNVDSASTGPAGSTDPSGSTAQGRNVAGDIRPEHDTDKTGVTSMHSDDPKFSDQKLSSANATSDGGTVGGAGAVDPSVGADPASGQAPQQKQQGADRPAEEPSADGVDAIKDRKDAAEQSAADRDSKAKSSGEGSGTQWVKTSGVAADGGDFDATKPGAGKEADRLLEKKGVHHGEAAGTDAGASPDGGDASGKTSAIDKIKGKLHMS